MLLGGKRGKTMPCSIDVSQGVISLLMIKGSLACFFMAVSSGLLGVFLVLRRMTLMADGLSHGLLPGVAFASILFGESLAGMVVLGAGGAVILAVATVWVGHRSQLTQDAVFSGLSLFAIGLGMFLMQDHSDHCHDLLAGSLMTLTWTGVAMMVGVAGLTGLFFAKNYRALFISSFDPLFFEMQGGNTKKLEVSFLALLTLNLVVSVQILGTLMVLSVIVIPALIMRVLTQKLNRMLAGSVTIAAIVGVISVIASRHNPNQCGTVITLTLGALYCVALGYDLARPVFFSHRS